MLRANSPGSTGIALSDLSHFPLFLDYQTTTMTTIFIITSPASPEERERESQREKT